MQVTSARYLDIAPATTMGAARGDAWAMVTKMCKFHDASPILPILQKDSG